MLSIFFIYIDIKIDKWTYVYILICMSIYLCHVVCHQEQDIFVGEGRAQLNHARTTCVSQDCPR